MIMRCGAGRSGGQSETGRFGSASLIAGAVGLPTPKSAHEHECGAGGTARVQ